MAKSMAVYVSISGNTVSFNAQVTCTGESYRGSHRTGSYSVSGPGGAITSGTFTSAANKNSTTVIHSGTCGTNGCGTYTASYVYDSGSWNLTNSGSAAVGHTNNATGALRTAATCTAAATYWYKCSRCGTQASTYFTSGNALGHSNTAAGALRTSATCTAAATYWYKCSRCGTQASTYYSSGSALGHSNTATGALRSNATCTAPATYWYKCSRCNTQSSSYFNSGNALGHSNTAAGALRSAATCTEAATYWYNCSRCGVQSTSYYSSGSALGHAWPTDFTYVDNNGITRGARYKNCTTCNGRLHTQFGIWANVGIGIKSTSGTNWYDSGATASISAAADTGYIWGKWSDNNTSASRSITANAAYSLTATANPITYTVVYDGNGATGGSTSNSTHTYNAAKALNANGYTKPGYKFIGWSTSNTGGVVYTNQQSVSNLTSTNNATVTLYAVWELSANAQFGKDGKWKPVMLYVGKNGKWNNVTLDYGQNNKWKATGL